MGTFKIHRQWQWSVLAEFVDKVKWVAELESFNGVFYCNELLDACPAERLIWKDDAWWLSLVESDGQSFGWGMRPGGKAKLGDELTPEEGAIFTVGDYGVWQAVCNSLKRGQALVVDYGMTEREFLDPPRENGTLRGYHRHRMVDDVLTNPGEVDITASVNFTRVERIAEAIGLEMVPLTRQSQYLVSLFEQTLQRPELFPEWTPDRTRQFQTLVHPEHLGHSFKVLECSRPRPLTSQLFRYSRFTKAVAALLLLKASFFSSQFSCCLGNRSNPAEQDGFSQWAGVIEIRRGLPSPRAALMKDSQWFTPPISGRLYSLYLSSGNKMAFLREE